MASNRVENSDRKQAERGLSSTPALPCMFKGPGSVEIPAPFLRNGLHRAPDASLALHDLDQKGPAQMGSSSPRNFPSGMAT
jgi:hypothetical protein